MIKDFFVKKENIFIIVVALVSIFFVVLGFLFLFFRADNSTGPKVIPNSVSEIVWEDFSSKILDQRIEYPEYLHISEQREENGVGVTIAEFEPNQFLNYFSNQNHISFYPNGIDALFFYGKTKESDFVSETGQEYKRTEYLTTQGDVWGVMLVPKKKNEAWQDWGFVFIQTKIRNKEDKCMTESGLIIDSVSCDPYAGQKAVYSGTISGRFIDIGYAIVNRNSFK